MIEDGQVNIVLSQNYLIGDFFFVQLSPIYISCKVMIVEGAWLYGPLLINPLPDTSRPSRKFSQGRIFEESKFYFRYRTEPEKSVQMMTDFELHSSD